MGSSPPIFLLPDPLNRRRREAAELASSTLASRAPAGPIREMIGELRERTEAQGGGAGSVGERRRGRREAAPRGRRPFVLQSRISPSSRVSEFSGSQVSVCGDGDEWA